MNEPWHTFAATHCNTLQRTATHGNTLQCTAMHGNALQHTATYCNTLQHTDVPYAMGVKRQKKKANG